MIKELRNQHRTIIQMAFSGFKNCEIAERLSMAESTISGILRSPLGQAYMGGLHDKSKENTLDVRKQLISMNSSALSAFERILSPSGKAPYAVQFNTAKDILDRNGFKPTDKINIDMTLQSKSDEEIDAEINALANSIATAKIAEVEAEEVEAEAISTIETINATEYNSTEQEPLNDIEEPSENLINSPTLTNLGNTSNEPPEGSSILLGSVLGSELPSELTKTSIDIFPPK